MSDWKVSTRKTFTDINDFIKIANKEIKEDLWKFIIDSEKMFFRANKEDLNTPTENIVEVKLFSNIPAIQLAKASHCVRPLCGVALRDGMFVVRK